MASGFHGVSPGGVCNIRGETHSIALTILSTAEVIGKWLLTNFILHFILIRPYPFTGVAAIFRYEVSQSFFKYPLLC